MLCCDKRPGPDLSLAVPGLALFAEIEELLGEEAGVRRKGALVVHADSGGWAAEPERLRRLQAAGVRCSLLSVDGAARRRAVAARSAARGVVVSGRSAVRAAGDRAGVGAEAAGAGRSVGPAVRCSIVLKRRQRREPSRVEGVPHVRRPMGHFRAGPLGWRGSPRPRDPSLLPLWCSPAALGVPRSPGRPAFLPVEPRKGQLVRLEHRPDFLRHKVIDGSYMAAVESEDAGLQVSTVMETTLDGHVLVGSSRERRGFDLEVDPAVTDALIAAAARLAPGIERTHAGRRLGRPAPLVARRPPRHRRDLRRRGPLHCNGPRGRRRRAWADHRAADRADDLRRGAGPRPIAVRPGPVQPGLSPS